MTTGNLQTVKPGNCKSSLFSMIFSKCSPNIINLQNLIIQQHKKQRSINLMTKVNLVSILLWKIYEFVLPNTVMF